MEKEIRVYAITLDQLEEWLGANNETYNEYSVNKITDEEFITMAEEEGNVYSLKGFQSEFNYNKGQFINVNNYYIRII